MPRFGELEAAIMDVVWTAGHPLRVREVLEVLQRQRPLAYTTVQTVMEILRRKGWLSRERDGKAHRYAATRSREDYVAELMNEALAMAGDRTATLLRFFQGMDPDEVTQLRRALDAAHREETP
ncbi:CopY family transcriptional regulator [Carbonactinospora thermoautotrophica]|uniref:CopY family transcriptional regulator n=1 Tax=Carbonactinospora thermoautotrophica TaxID=1469144 RepID=A0A132NBV0_9ACTN|nr:BlaI/MecI/CopY family transcriptional regulator [Carbonactinospora thermoautotrophica]KWX02506.1 Transcriptional repressor [Carbonactinospora thermoautotrophica]KWX03611.1 CopY family transcriptional regulator [Carbonactinospora thermoautotrophica]KWX07563.1 CopY family transcriptional regulator [Carbonactinospora thermoautotrophica]